MKRLRLSTYILMTVVFLVVTSTLTIAGVVYVNMSKRLSAVFIDRLKAESNELSLVLGSHIGQIENRLKELSRDNSIRVTLMPGADQQLREHLHNVYQSVQGAHFFVRSDESGMIFRASDLTLPDDMIQSLLDAAPHRGIVRRSSLLGGYWACSLPIYRQNERIGSAACLYIFRADAELQKVVGNKLAFRYKDQIWHLFTGQRIRENVDDPMVVHTVQLPLGCYEMPEGTQAGMDAPVNLMHIASRAPLESGKRQVLWLVLLSSCGVLSLAIVLSYFLSRKLSAPLQGLSEMAKAVAEGRTYGMQGEQRINIMEVEHLRESLDSMLAHLREADELRRYQKLFEGVADPIFIHDAAGRFLEANDVALKQFGYDLQAFLELHIGDLMPEMDDENCYRILTQQLDREGQHQFESTIVTRPGERFFVECHARVITFKRQKAVLSVVRDITDRKKAEDALKSSEMRYRSIVENSHDGIVLIDEDFRFRYVNAEFCRITARSRSELLGTDFRLLLDDTSRERVVANYRKRQSGASVPTHYAFNILRASGEKRRVEISASVVKNERDEMRAMAQLLDITDRNKAKEELRKSEQRLALALDVSQAGAWELDLETGTLLVDMKLFKRFGFAPEEFPVTLKELESLVDPRLRSGVHQRLMAYRAGKRSDYADEFRIRTPGGKWRWIHQKARMVQADADRPSGSIIGTMMDITERKRVELALKESEERYRTILDSNNAGYFEVDLQGKFTFFNQAMCDIIGSSPDEVEGQSYRFYTDEATAEWVFQSYQDVYVSGKPIKTIEYPYRNKQGEQRIIESSVFLIQDHDGAAVGFRGLARDMTDQRNMESRLRHAQKMEALGTLAGGVAHDLNNILSGVVSYPELILMDLPDDSPLYQPIQTIKMSGEKAATIVQDLLTLARRGVAVKEVTNWNRIVADYVASPEFHKLKSFHPGFEIDVKSAADLFNVSGSPVHLAKTVMNLVSNGAEAMADGGCLTLETFNCYVDEPIGAYDRVAEGDYAVLRVHDKGIGMTAEELNKIFEPFYSKKVMGRSGTGLGMAVVWGTVKDHDGYIDVASREGYGTIFTIYLPAEKQSLESSPMTVSLEDLKGRGESVLIVDDVPEQREIASKILHKLGYKVDSAASGEEAIRLLERCPMDIVLLDMIMAPGIDGLDTYRRMIALSPGQKAIIASGFSETDRVREAQRLGVGGYIKKPYRLDQIGLALKKALRP